MRRLLLILALLVASPCFGQNPVPIQANTGAGTCTYNANVVSGDLLVAVSGWLTSTNTPSVSDTVGGGATWSQLLLDTSTTSKISIYVATAAGSGADTITFSVTSAASQKTACLEYSPGGISLTKDVSSDTAYTSQTSITSGTIATTMDSDLIISGCYSSANASYTTTPPDMLMTSSANPVMLVGHRIAGAHGNYTSTCTTGNSSSGTIFILAIKPTAIAVTSPSALPDGYLSDVYSYTLQEQGATASVTWSITSGLLPTGLSLNSSTGVITGTPTSSTTGFTVKVDDGTTSNSKAVTLKIGNSANSISHVQDSSPDGSFSSDVTAGNFLIGVCTIGANANSVSKATDTLGTVYTFIMTISVSNNVSTQYIYTGTAPSTGADTFSCSNAVTRIASEFTKVNSINDSSTLNIGTTGTSLTTGTYTTLATNSLIYAGWIGQNNVTNTITAPCNATFTHFLSVVNSGCYEIATTEAGYTENMTTSGASGNWSSMITGFRPTANGTGPAAARGYPVIF